MQRFIAGLFSRSCTLKTIASERRRPGRSLQDSHAETLIDSDYAFPIATDAARIGEKPYSALTHREAINGTD